MGIYALYVCLYVVMRLSLQKRSVNSLLILLMRPLKKRKKKRKRNKKIKIKRTVSHHINQDTNAFLLSSGCLNRSIKPSFSSTLSLCSRSSFHAMSLISSSPTKAAVSSSPLARGVQGACLTTLSEAGAEPVSLGSRPRKSLRMVCGSFRFQRAAIFSTRSASSILPLATSHWTGSLRKLSNSRQSVNLVHK